MGVLVVRALAENALLVSGGWTPISQFTFFYWKTFRVLFLYLYNRVPIPDLACWARWGRGRDDEEGRRRLRQYN